MWTNWAGNMQDKENNRTATNYRQFVNTSNPRTQPPSHFSLSLMSPRLSYSLKTKLSAIEYAEKYTCVAASEKFLGTASKKGMISRWVKNKEKMSNYLSQQEKVRNKLSSQRKRRLPGGGAKSPFTEQHIKQLRRKVNDERQKGFIVNTRKIREYCTDILQDSREKEGKCETLVSGSVAHSYAKKAELSSYRIGGHRTNHKRNEKWVIYNFVRDFKNAVDSFVANKRNGGEVNRTHILNMDEMNREKETTASYTYDLKGEKHHGVVHFGSNHQGFTIIPLISMSGEVVNVCIITKGKSNRVKKLHDGKLVLLTSPTAFNNERVMLQWIEHCLPVIPAGMGILVLDHAACHLTEKVKNGIWDKGFKPIFVPESHTHLLQPLDVGFNSVISKTLHEKTEIWQKQEFDRAHREGRKTTSMPVDIFRHNVYNACMEASSQTIVNAWKRSGLWIEDD